MKTPLAAALLAVLTAPSFAGPAASQDMRVTPLLVLEANHSQASSTATIRALVQTALLKSLEAVSALEKAGPASDPAAQAGAARLREAYNERIEPSLRLLGESFTLTRLMITQSQVTLTNRRVYSLRSDQAGLADADPCPGGSTLATLGRQRKRVYKLAVKAQKRLRGVERPLSALRAASYARFGREFLEAARAMSEAAERTETLARRQQELTRAGGKLDAAASAARACKNAGDFARAADAVNGAALAFVQDIELLIAPAAVDATILPHFLDDAGKL